MNAASSRRPRDSKRPEYIKDVLARDYKIPGIGRRYYVPVTALLLSAAGIFAWNFWWYTSDDIFVGAVLLLLGLATGGRAVQRLTRRIRRQ